MTRSDCLLPREHGVYAELAFPLTTGLLLGEVTLASLGFAATIAFGVLIHEPFAIMTGRRGKRLHDALRERARRRAVTLAFLMTVTATTALISAPLVATRWALVPLGFTLLLAPLLTINRAKTLLGELLVVGALTTSLLPIAIAGGVAWPTAMAASAVWFVSFILGTVTVHAVKQHHKEKAEGAWAILIAPVLGLMAIAGGLVGAARVLLPPAVVVALVPPVLVALAICIARVHPRNLRTVGWSLVSANVITLCVLLLWL